MESAEPAPADWTRWFAQHGPRLLLCARQWARSAADAEDLVQEAFVRYWRSQRSLAGEPFPLLLTSIRRAALDRWRRDRRRDDREEAAQAGDPECWFDPEPGEAERTARLEAALRRLPEAQRDVLVLKIWGELTFQEIARHLEISPNTAASRYRYALEALRGELTLSAHHE